MKVVDGSISRDELCSLAQGLFGNMVKAVVDMMAEVIALDAELHADLERSFCRAVRIREIYGESTSIPTNL